MYNLQYWIVNWSVIFLLIQTTYNESFLKGDGASPRHLDPLVNVNDGTTTPGGR